MQYDGNTDTWYDDGTDYAAYGEPSFAVQQQAPAQDFAVQQAPQAPAPQNTDWAAYTNAYSDLADAAARSGQDFGVFGQQHYAQYGANEGRALPGAQPRFAIEAPAANTSAATATSGIPDATSTPSFRVADDVWNQYAARDPGIQAEAAKLVGKDPRFQTPEDYYKWHYEHFGAKSGALPIDTSGLSPTAQQYVKEMADYMASASGDNTNADPLGTLNPFAPGTTLADIERMAALKVPVASRFATTYTSFTNGGDPRFVTVAPGQNVRLVDSKTGNVVFSGTGPEAAAAAAQQASAISQDRGKKAAWTIETEDPATGGWNVQAKDEKDYSSNLLGTLADIALQIVAAAATAGASLPIQAAAAAAATVPRSLAEGMSLKQAVTRAAVSAATAGTMKATGIGDKISNSLGLGSNIAPSANPSLLPTNIIPAGTPFAPSTLFPVSGFTGNLASNAATSAATAAGGNTLGTTVGQLVLTAPKIAASTAPNWANIAANAGLNYAANSLANSALSSSPSANAQTNTQTNTGDPNDTLLSPAEVLLKKGYTPDAAQLLLAGGTIGGVGLAAALQSATPGSVAGESLNGLSQAERDAIATQGKLNPLQTADLALRGVNLATSLAGLLGAGGGKGGGGTGAAGTRASLSPIFSAQLGAPKGLFSALGSAGTPYTPRPIQSLLAAGPTSGGAAAGASDSSFAVPSNTALDDYLNRYPDVAAEATRSASHYGDINRDGVVDRRDFALGHYLEYGPSGAGEPRTMGAKTGGYVEKHAGDPSMAINRRFQVLHKADGGLIDPRALAESYHSGTPADMSVFQDSPYRGYEPGTMGGAYHYGELPGGEQRYFNYAMAPGAVAPWMSSTPTGPGVYDLYGKPVTTGTTGAAAADPNVWWNVPTHKDWQQIDPTTGLLESSAAAPWGADVTMDPKWGALQNMTTNQQLAKATGYGGVFGQGGFQNWILQQPENVKTVARQILLANNEGGRIAFRRGGSTQFAVEGAGDGRSDDIPARLSDGEYVIDAETVALLGDGSSKAGAKKLDEFRVNIRKQKGRDLAKGRFSADAKPPGAYLTGGRV
jgi:hypothetical protein